MKKLILLSSLLAAMLLAACGDSNEDEATPEELERTTGAYMKTGNLVGCYFAPDSLHIVFAPPSRIPIILYNWDSVNRQQKYIRGRDSIKEYSTYYGDSTYNAFHLGCSEYLVSIFPLNSISITADRDFDAEHPAGSLLNDLFVFEYSSAYDVIKSGYEPALDMTNACWGGAEWEAYQLMPLSQFEPKSLLYCLAELYFTKLPENLGEYTFYVTFEFGSDPVSGMEPKKFAPVEVKAMFTDKDYVSIPVRGKSNGS